MKSINVLFILLFSIQLLSAQNTSEKKGFIFGTAIGISSLKLTKDTGTSEKQTALSFPNFKIGKMLSDQSALLLYLPGSVYNYKEDGRERNRGFEAILPTYQYWFSDRIWAMAGIGVGMDAPAFYDIKSAEERTFNFGFATATAVGYEIIQMKKATVDIQARLHYGSIKVAEQKLNGLGISILVGFNLN